MIFSDDDPNHKDDRYDKASKICTFYTKHKMAFTGFDSFQVILVVVGMSNLVK
jgi:hypothetical protein